MKCTVNKKLYCPIRKRYVERGETIDVDKKNIDGYLPYVEVIETAEKKDPKKRTAKKVK